MTEVQQEPISNNHELCSVEGQNGDKRIFVKDLSMDQGCCGKPSDGVQYDKIDGAKCEMGKCGRQAYSVCGTAEKG